MKMSKVYAGNRHNTTDLRITSKPEAFIHMTFDVGQLSLMFANELMQPSALQ